MDHEDRQRQEFARLLRLSFACRQDITAQQALIRSTISAGDRDAAGREWQELTRLLLEEKMLSRRLREVFTIFR